jgi:hypothetical protein
MIRINVKTVLSIIGILILLSVISFLLLLKFSPSLRLSLFGGEISVPPEDIQFRVEKVPQRNYYLVHGQYIKCSTGLLYMNGHLNFFKSESGASGLDILYSPISNRIYGGRLTEEKEKKWELYYLGQGKVEGKVLKPVFPKGTKFTFRMVGSLEITDAPGYYITIYIPGILEKIGNEELKENVIAEIVEDFSKRYHFK